MNEQYLRDLYNWILSKDKSFNEVSVDKFVNSIKSDESYAREMHSWISQIDRSFMPIDEFLVSVRGGVQDKKKDPFGVKQDYTQIQEKKPMVLAPEQEEPTESSSEVGSSDSYNLVESVLQQSKDKIQKDKLRQYEQPVQEDQVLPQVKQEQYLARPKEQMQERTVFDEKMAKIEEETPEFMKSAIKGTEISLAQKSKQAFIEDLNYSFNDAGFTFTQVGPHIVAKAPDGTTESIRMHADPEQILAEVTYMIKTKSAKLKNLDEIEKLYTGENKKFSTDKQVEANIKDLADEQDLLVKSMNEYASKKKEAEKILADINSMPLEKRDQNYRNLKYQAEQTVIALNAEGLGIEEKLKELPVKQRNLEKAIGKYVTKQEQQGSWVGGIWNSAMNFIGGTVSGLTGNLIDLSINVLPTQMTMDSKERDELYTKKLAEWGFKPTDVIPEDVQRYVTAEVKDEYKKRLKYGNEDDITYMEGARTAFKEYFGDKSTTQQWTDLTKSGFVSGALLGAAETLPAMLLPGGWMRQVAMYAWADDMITKEFEADPELNALSENEKLLVKVPIGIVSAVLEDFALSNVIKGTGITKNITNKILSKAVPNMSVKAFKELAETEIGTMVKTGALRVVGGALSEFETGAAQEAVNIGVKSIYNTVKGKEMFDTPDTVVDVVSDIFVSGLQEAIGGAAMSAPFAVAEAFSSNKIAGIPNEYFDIFSASANDENVEKAFIATLKNDVASGKRTKQNAVDLLNNYRRSVGLLRSIPEEIQDTEGKKQAMSLMRERKSLEDKMVGKDEALAKPIKERIAKINDQLAKITEDAIQKQAAGQVPVQSEAGVSQEVEGGAPETEPQGLTDQEIQRKEILTQELAKPGDGDVIIDGETIIRQDAQAELDAITQKAQVELKPEVQAERVTAEAPMTTADIFTAAPKETKADMTFIAPDGIEMQFEGNEQVAADMYDAAVVTPEDQRTPEQIDVIEKMEPIVLDHKADMFLRSIQPTAKTETIEEGGVAPVEFTEQDAARKTELESSLAAVDKKKRRDIRVGNQSMTRAEIKAELDALNQKELSSKQQVPAITPVETKVTTEERSKIVQAANNASKAISKILPNVKIVLHDTIDDYVNATGDTDESSGLYVPDGDGGGVIHINMTNANSRTVGHETFHAILLRGIKSDAEAQRIAKIMLNAVIKSLKQSRSNNELLAKLEDFVSNYDENIQNEEFLAEVFGYLADGYPELPKPTKNIVQRFLERIAKMFGLKPMTDSEVIDFMNNISRKVAKGESISDRETIKAGSGAISEINKRFQANFTDPVSGLTFVYDKNDKRFADLENEKYITKDKSIFDFVGKYMLLHQPDAAFAGKIYKGDLLLVNGQGGMYYPVIFHDKGFFWASTDSAAKNMAKWLNAVSKQNGGTVYMALTTAPYDKLLSSTTMSNAVLDFFSSKAFDDNFNISESMLIDAVIKAANKKVVTKKVNKDTGEVTEKLKGLRMGLKKGLPLSEITELVKDKLSADKSIFADRKLFAETLIDEMAKYINKDQKAIDQFGKLFSEGIQNKYFKGVQQKISKGKVVGETIKISKTNMIQAISEMFTEPILKDGVDRKNGGQVYAVLEVTGDITPVEIPIDKGGHISYPIALKASGKTKIHILKDREKWSDIFEDPTTDDLPSKSRLKKVYPSSGVSSGGKGLRVSSKKAPKKAGVSARQQKNKNTTFEQQDSWAEDVVGRQKNRWGRAQVWRERIENAGDILREISGRGDFPDLKYIYEKIEKLKNWLIKDKPFSDDVPSGINTLEDVESDKMIKFTTVIDGRDYLVKFHSDVLNETIEAYESINVSTEQEQVVKDLVLALLRSNKFGDVYGPLRDVEDIADKIKRDGKLVSTPISSRKQKKKVDTKPAEDVVAKGRANGVSDAVIKAALKKLGYNDAVIAQVMGTEAKGKVTLSEETLPGYGKLMSRIKGVAERSRERAKKRAKALEEKTGEKTPDAEIEEQVMEDVMLSVEGSEIYENATDQQREEIMREIRSMFGLKEKKAPAAEKITGKPKPKKVTVKEYAALKDQLRLEARAAREAKADLNKKRKILAAVISGMAKSGKISARQADVIIKRINAVNLDNPDAVQALLDYAEKVFNDADYGDKLSTAKSLQKAIKKLSGNKKKFGNLSILADKFSKIDPSMVEDIDQYIEMASAVKEGVEGSKLTPKGVRAAAMVDVDASLEYVEDMMEAQNETIRLRTAEKIEKMLGVDVKDLTYKEMLQLIDPGKPDAKIEAYKETIIRDAINKLFDTYSAIIDDMLNTGIDSFTGDPITFSKSDEKLVREFMAMDLSQMDTKDALRAADALNNFIVNKSTANMANVLARHTGKMNAKAVAKKGIKADSITMYWNNFLGRNFYDLFASIPLMFEKAFKGSARGAYVEKMMGVTSLINHKAEAMRMVTDTVNEYAMKFSKSKPNGKAFQSAYNVIERGIVADLSKTIAGSDEQVQAEFNRRKKLIQQSIEILRKGGTKKESQMADVMEEIYNKIARDSENIKEVKEKADKINTEAVQFWIDKWAGLYDQFADVALNVYNKVLIKSVDYTPDRFGFLERAEPAKDLEDLDSTFIAGSNYEVLYKTEAGSLKEPKPPGTLVDKNGKGEMYVNLSFDTNNANAMLEALVDIKTAADIRQIQAFESSPEFEELFPNGRDAKMFKKRVALLVRNIRGKRIVVDKAFKDVTRALDKLAAYGASMALAGPTQMLKQSVPVMMNTVINSGSFKGMDLSSAMSSDVINFVNSSGMPIANRGIDAVTELESLNRKIEMESSNMMESGMRTLEKWNERWLKVFLSNVDIVVARASWIAYYEQALKKQGIKGKIDYSTHEINQEAAEYAQRMVDRQQNISDKDLAGSMYGSDNPQKQFLVKMLFPFATFRLNQTTRMMNDITVVYSKTATKEDKALAKRSLVGLTAEMITFRALSLGIGWTLYQIAQGIRGEEDDEEEQAKKWKNMLKGVYTSAVSDIFSPLPPSDDVVKIVINEVLNQSQAMAGAEEEDRYSLFTQSKESFAKTYGMFGIGMDKAQALYDDVQLARTGKYKDDWGNEKFVSESDREMLSWMMAIYIPSDFGLIPAPEVASIMRNFVKIAKSDSKTATKIKKEKAYGGYETIKELEENDPELYDELSSDGGALDEYRKEQKEKDEEANKDEPFRGLSEKTFKERYPKEWREQYGPGTAYWKQKNSPEGRREAIEKAKRDKQREIAKAKKKREDAIRKARESRRN